MHLSHPCTLQIGPHASRLKVCLYQEELPGLATGPGPEADQDETRQQGEAPAEWQEGQQQQGQQEQGQGQQGGGGEHRLLGQGSFSLEELFSEDTPDKLEHVQIPLVRGKDAWGLERCEWVQWHVGEVHVGPGVSGGGAGGGGRGRYRVRGAGRDGSVACCRRTRGMQPQIAGPRPWCTAQCCAACCCPHPTSLHPPRARHLVQVNHVYKNVGQLVCSIRYFHARTPGKLGGRCDWVDGWLSGRSTWGWWGLPLRQPALKGTSGAWLVRLLCTCCSCRTPL